MALVYEFIPGFSSALQWFIYVSNASAMPYCSVVGFEIGKLEFSNFVFLFQYCFGYLGPLAIPYEFEDPFFHFCKRSQWSFLINLFNKVGIEYFLNIIKVSIMLNIKTL